MHIIRAGGEDLKVSAGAGGYIEITPGNNATTPPTSADDYVSLTLTTSQTGNHYFWARLLAPNSQDDSFWVRVDGGAWIKWNGNSGSSDWAWKKVHDSDNSEAQIVRNWQADTTHTIDIQPGQTLTIQTPGGGGYGDVSSVD